MDISRLAKFKDASPETLHLIHPCSIVESNLLDNLTDYFADIVNASPEKSIVTVY
ncbi:MAG TPA: hypothetical protein VIT44_11260 [Cyclobacteriaceae bacterium]